VLTATTASACAVEQQEQMKTPEDYYAMGERIGRCTAFFNFMIQGAIKGGKQETVANLARRREDWALATEIFLGMGHATDAKAAGQTIMNAEVARLNAHIEASQKTEATFNELIADYHKQCDPLEPWRDGALMAVRESIRNGAIVQPSPQR
jgi:hypothetical protein